MAQEYYDLESSGQEIDEAIEKTKNMLTVNNLIQGHGISIQKDENNNITINNTMAEHIQLLFLDMNENIPILTNQQPSENKTIMPITSLSATTGEWIDFLTVNVSDDIKDMEVQFIPNNRFSAKLWIISARSRDNIQIRMQVIDISDNAVLASATTKTNLLGDETIPSPILFENIHQELRELPLSQIQVVMSIMPSQSGIQIGVISNPLDEISYINITTSSGSSKDGMSAYEIAVKNGFEGTEQEWLESIQKIETTIVEGENILNRSTVGVSGILERISSPLHTFIRIKLIPDNDNNNFITSEGVFKAPKDGVYTIFCTWGYTSTSNMIGVLQKGNYDLMDVTRVIGYGNTPSGAESINPIISKLRLNEGDIVSLWFYFYGSQPTQNYSYFTIALDSSINLNTWDLYNQWKEQNPIRENITFDEWVNLTIKQSTMRCSGVIQDKAISAGAVTLMTPICQSGDSSMVDGNKFIAQTSGLYALSIGGGFCVVGVANHPQSTIIYNSEDFKEQNVVAHNINYGVSYIPSITKLIWLDKGEYLTYFITTSYSTSSINASDNITSFEFAMISGGDGGDQGKDGLSAYEIAIKNGFEGTEQKWLDSITTIVEGENILNRSTIGINGKMKEISFGPSWTKVNFIPLYGNITDINNNGEWICPQEGIYKLSASLNFVSGANPSTLTHNVFQINNPNQYDDSSHAGYTMVAGSATCGTSNAIVKLNKGDNISFWVYSNTSLTMSSFSNFVFTLDTSINITAWSAYETWQSLDTENNTASFNEWVEDKLRDSVLFGAPIGFTIPMMRNDDIVIDSDGVWIKANGAIYDPEEYPTTEKLKGFEITPIARMTSDTTPEPFIATLSNWDGNPDHSPYRVFDKFFIDKRIIDENESYFGSPVPCILTIDLSDKYADILNAISMYPITVGNGGYIVSASPKNFTIQASNNNSSWTTLLTKTNVSNWTIDGLKFEFNNNTKYRYYRINITAINGHTYCHLKEVKLHGTLFHRSPNLPKINEMYQYIKIKQRILTNIDKQIELSSLISKDNDNALGLGTDERFFVKKVSEQESEKEYVPLGLPVGYVATMAQTDEFIKADDGIWIRANGVYYDINEYPDAPKLVGFEDTPLPLMTSDTTPEPFVLTTTNPYGAPHYPYQAFNKTVPSEWLGIEYHGYVSTPPCILTIDLSNAFADIIYSMQIYPSDVENSTYIVSASPKNFTIQASNNGTSWTTLLTKSNVVDWTLKGLIFEFDNDTKYRYYRLNVTANNGWQHIHIAQIKLKGKLFHRSACLPQIDGMYQYVKIKQGLSFEPSEPQEKDLLLGIQQEGIPIGNVKKLNFSDMLKLNVVDDTANIDISVKAPILMTSPIGTTIQTMWTDSKVIFNGGVWLRLNGQKFSGEEYPELINMAGIEGISDPLSPAMTSNTAPSGYSASATSTMSGHAPWYAFNKKPDNVGWVSLATAFNKTTGIGSQELRLKLNATKKLGWYIIRSRGDGVDEIDFPMNFTIWGSPTSATGGTEWVLLDTRTNINRPLNQDGSPEYAPIAFQIPNADDNPEYLHYKIQVTQIKPDNLGYVSIGAFELYAPTSEYILPAILPTAQGLNTYVYAKDLTSQIIADIDYIAAMMGVNLDV